MRLRLARRARRRPPVVAGIVGGVSRRRAVNRGGQMCPESNLVFQVRGLPLNQEVSKSGLANSPQV